MIKFANLSVKYQITREYLAPVLQLEPRDDKLELSLRRGTKGKFLSYAFLHSHRILFKFLPFLRSNIGGRRGARTCELRAARKGSRRRREGREMDSAPTETLSPASSELCLFFASFLIPESSLGMDNKCMIVYYIGMENENLIPFR